MKRDDLNRPLGVDDPPRRRVGRSVVWTTALTVGVAASAYGVWAARTHGARSDRAFADIIVEAPPAPAAPDTPPRKAPDAADSTGVVENGVRVFRGGALPPPPGATIQIPSDDAEAPRGAQAGLPAAPDPRLVENGKPGPLPKIAPDGARPFDAYKRPLFDLSSAPRFAVVLTGLGLTGETLRAADGVPAETSFAFAPIGRDLWTQTAQARAAGHEILLESPMQALLSDPGSKWDHELTVEAGPARNLSDLRWAMSRFPGFFAVMNFRGAKLTMDRGAMTPILQEIGARGLGWLDGGSSPASLAPAIASTLGLNSARADLTLDPNQLGPALDAALARFEKTARANGSAILAAPALPSVIERLKTFEADAAADGLRLVPVSALMPRSTDRAASTR